MAKAKKVDKNKDKKTLKYFTSATVQAINEELQDVTLEDLINNIYLKSDDEDISYFIKQYEKQLILSKLDYEKFERELHQFYLDMADYIKVNGLYKKFLKLNYLQNGALCKNDVKIEIVSGYQDLIVQQFPYLSGTSKKVVCGINKKGNLMTVNESGQYLTEINYDLHVIALRMSHEEEAVYQDAMVKTFNKYGYKVKDIYECQEIIVNDQIITNMLYFMSNFITEETKEILPMPYRKPIDLVNANSIFLFSTTNVPLIKEKLNERQMLLPSEGVNLKLNNCGDIKEIYFLETIEDDTVVLLFKVKFSDNTYVSGYYDTKDEIFYDMWRDSSKSEVTHTPLENIVLQNYLNLTCSLTKEEKKALIWFKEVNNLDKLEDNTEKNPIVYYEIKEKKITNKREIKITRYFDRAKYIAELMNIKPFLRNLPLGANVGEEAIETAIKLGIELPPGKTLVRGFIKKVYRNEEQLRIYALQI